jgi:phosphatidylglycerol:prolipoprotein diacylglycerol transferase
MHPVLFTVFGRPIGTYGVFLIIGAVAAWFIVQALGGKKDKDIQLVFFISVCGGLIGSFILRPLMKLPEVIINWEVFRQLPVHEFISFMFGEIVFYGGLIGGAIAMLLFCRGFNIPILPIADIFAPALSIAHAFGRVGCFFGGCCYGIKVDQSNPLAVVFPPHNHIHGLNTPGEVIQNTPVLAIQLIEAACLLVLAAVLLLILKKAVFPGLVVCLYGLLYSSLRFVLEFFRGDLRRGIYGLFSTSQYISMVLFAVSLVLLFLLIKSNKNENK